MITKKGKISDILKKKNIKIVENSHYVLSYGEIDLDSVDENFNFGNYKVKKLKSKTSDIKIDFSVFKDGKLVLDCVSAKKVRDYIKKISNYRY